MFQNKTKYIFVNEYGDIKEMVLSYDNAPRGLRINNVRPVEVFVIGPIREEVLYKTLEYVLHPVKRIGITHFEDYEGHKDSSVEELKAWGLIDGTRY